MSKFTKWWLGLVFTFIGWWVSGHLEYSIKQTIRIINKAPLCKDCGEFSEYVGETLGFTSSRFYQCPKCKKIFMTASS